MPQRLQRIWYGNAPVPLWLGLLEPVYRALRAAHQAPWKLGLRRPRRLPLPVLVVGNLVAGGAGKTPLVIALARALADRGLKPGVVSRGHGGRARGPLLLGPQPDPAEVGDEPCLIAAATGMPVAVGRDRPAAAALLASAGVDVVIADDGLQNPSLARDLEVCVVDGRRRFGNGRLLPAGPLREPIARLASVDHVVCNGGRAGRGEVQMTLHGSMAVPLAGGPGRPLGEFSGQRVHAVAGIGDPARFFASLDRAGMDIIAHPFPDHHAFEPADLAFDDALPVLMTAKDAIKCRRFADSRMWQIPVSAQLPEAFLDTLAAALQARAGGVRE